MQDLFDISNLETRRRLIRLPVGQLCKSVGLNPSTWERMRNGLTEPRLSTAKRIAEILEAEELRILAHLIELHPEAAAALLAGRGEAGGTDGAKQQEAAA